MIKTLNKTPVRLPKVGSQLPFVVYDPKDKDLKVVYTASGRLASIQNNDDPALAPDWATLLEIPFELEIETRSFVVTNLFPVKEVAVELPVVLTRDNLSMGLLNRLKEKDKTQFKKPTLRVLDDIVSVYEKQKFKKLFQVSITQFWNNQIGLDIFALERYFDIKDVSLQTWIMKHQGEKAVTLVKEILARCK